MFKTVIKNVSSIIPNSFQNNIKRIKFPKMILRLSNWNINRNTG